MKKLWLIALLFVFVFGFVSSALAIVHVNGYFRKNGTYVAPHYRSDPDGITSNNWSYPGNTNPMTGVTTPGGSYTAPIIPTYVPPPTITCPLNSYLATDNKCYCNSGYIISGTLCITTNQNCQNYYGINSYGDAKYCYCNADYQWNSTKTQCINTATINDLLKQIADLQRQINELLNKNK